MYADHNQVIEIDLYGYKIIKLVFYVPIQFIYFLDVLYYQYENIGQIKDVRYTYIHIMYFLGLIHF